MRKIVDLRLAITTFIVAIFVLSQFLCRMEGMAGADCMKRLVNPVAGSSEKSEFPTYYGFPLAFATTYTKGCFENQTTFISSVDLIMLLVDILFVGVIGTLPYWFLVLWRRYRHHDATQTDSRE